MVLPALLLPAGQSQEAAFCHQCLSSSFHCKAPELTPGSPGSMLRAEKSPHRSKRQECKRADNLRCVCPPKYAIDSPEEQLTKSAYSVRYKCWDRDNFLHRPMWRLLVESGPVTLSLAWGQAHKRRLCHAEKPMGAESFHPAPPVVEFRWDTPNMWEKNEAYRCLKVIFHMWYLRLLTSKSLIMIFEGNPINCLPVPDEVE